MKKELLLPTLGLMVLTGCDAVRDSLPLGEPLLVFPAGYMISVSGQDIPVQGFDRCPSQDALMTKVFGSASDDGAHTCVVLSEDRSTVPVRVFLPSGSVIEHWQIIRETAPNSAYKSTTLKRPDGSWVIPARR